MQLRGLTPLARERDAIDVAFAQAAAANPGKTKKEIAKSLFLDVSQNCDRGGNRFVHKVPCVTQSTLVYSYERDVLLSGQAIFSLSR